MLAFLPQSIHYAGAILGPGFREVSAAEYHGLAQCGPIRPATVDEAQRHASAAAPAPESAPERECAEARPPVETAAGSILTVRRRRVPAAAGAPAETAAA